MISFNKACDLFEFGRDAFTRDEVGSMLARALGNGSEQVDCGSVTVTVGYLTGMLRFAGKHGWFWDSFDIMTGDHEFDANTPTPGHNFAKLQEWKRYAAECQDYALRATAANAYPDVEHWKNEERTTNAQIHEYLASGGVAA
jgi:hypothetical protein